MQISLVRQHGVPPVASIGHTGLYQAPRQAYSHGPSSNQAHRQLTPIAQAAYLTPGYYPPSTGQAQLAYPAHYAPQQLVYHGQPAYPARSAYPDPTWHMDTSASSHLNFNASNLSTVFYKRLYPSVHVGDDNSIPVTNTGHSVIPSIHRPLHLNNVLVICLGFLAFAMNMFLAIGCDVFYLPLSTSEWYLEQHQSQLLQQHSQQQTKQKAQILDAIEDLNFRVRKKNQLLHKKKIIGFPTHRSCASPLLNSFDTLDLIRVVPTYHQDEDEDAHAIQDDNPAITKLIHVEYSRDDIAKTETPMVIEEDEKLMVFTSTKVHELPMENKSIDPKEVTNILSSTKENQHQIVFVHQESLMSLSRHCTSHYYPMVQVEIKGLSELSFKTRSRLIWNEVKSHYFVKRSFVKGGLIMADTSKARHLSTYNKFRNKEKKKHVWSTTIPPDELEVEFFSRWGE
ncbi:hypothetical protein Tco_0032880 [Tanacetum coccineum]